MDISCSEKLEKYGFIHILTNVKHFPEGGKLYTDTYQRRKETYVDYCMDHRRLYLKAYYKDSICELCLPMYEVTEERIENFMKIAISFEQ